MTFVFGNTWQSKYKQRMHHPFLCRCYVHIYIKKSEHRQFTSIQTKYRKSYWWTKELKKLSRAEGGAKIFGVFRVKNHDFTQKYHIFSNCGGRRQNVWGISCEKSRFYANKSSFFQFSL